MSSAISERQGQEPPSAGRFEAVRSRFPTLQSLTYLNSGSYGLLADSVQAAMLEYLQLRLEKGADWDSWVERSERVRAKTARLFNVDPGEIAVTASASAGINSLASAIDFSGERNRVVLSNYEFPTSGQIWHAQQRRGAILDYVPESPDRTIPLEHFAGAIDDRTRLVVLSHVCYRHGGKIPDDDIRAIAELAHRHGALLLLDAYQSVGSEAIDLRALDVDFAVGGMLKYLLGTAGIGFLYARTSLVEQLTPSMTGWFAQEDIGAMDMFRNQPSSSAARFQAGTPPVPSCYAADAGLDIILEMRADSIGARVRELTGHAIAALQAEGFRIATPLEPSRRGPMIAVEAKDDQAVVQALLQRKIVTSSRDGNLRAGFHFYNNEGDIDALVGALREVRPLLG
jgi:selenocysteine lyase/cysteine desulfurase